MVCFSGKGRMAVLARLFPASSVSHNPAEEICQQKIAGRFIYQDFREADEANLLSEEDMHVFGLNPLTDPLHLVSCNACKKPVKVSQYTAHAELCRSIAFGKEMQLELNGNVKLRKPPRKAKKKLLSDNGNESSLPQLNGFRSTTINLEGSTAKNEEGVVAQNASKSDAVKSTPAKRLKIISRQLPLQGIDSEGSLAVGKPNNFQQQHSYTEVYRQSAFEMGTTNGVDATLEKPNENCCHLRDGVAIPFATKIYYSQKNRRLRSVLAHFYHAGAISSNSGLLISKNQQVLSQRDARSCLEDNLQPEPREPGSIESSMSFARLSEAIMDKQFGSYSALENTLPSRKASHMETSYIDTKGRLITTAQQPNGSVPVT